MVWKDGTTTWLSLKKLKENNLIEVVEYASFAEIMHELTLAW